MAHHGKSDSHRVKEQGIRIFANWVAPHAWIFIAAILMCPDGFAQQVVPMQIALDCGMSMHSAGDSPRAAQLRFHGFMAGFNGAVIRCVMDSDDESRARLKMLRERSDASTAQTDGEISYYTYYFGASVEDRRTLLEGLGRVPVANACGTLEANEHGVDFRDEGGDYAVALTPEVRRWEESAARRGEVRITGLKLVPKHESVGIRRNWIIIHKIDGGGVE